MSGAPPEIAAAVAGYVKDVSKTKENVRKYRDYWKELGDTYMTVDFAFSYAGVLKTMNPDLAEQIRQRRSGWCGFVPFCPESPEGWNYYTNYFYTGARFTLDCGLNVGVWELFNESAYGCECEWNKKAFAEASERRYGSVAAANAAWGTDFLDFGMLARAPDYGRFKGLWNEWCEFLARRYSDFLKDCRGVIEAFDRRPNVYFTEQLSLYQIWDGMTDYRRISEALDLLVIEGGWNYGGTLEQQPRNEMEAIVFASSDHWYALDFFNALTRGHKPVVNNELYCTRTEGGSRVPSRAEDLVTSLWTEFFHGLAASYVYIWEKRAWEWRTFEEAKANVISPSYKSSALLNPYNWPPDQLDAFGRFLDELGKWQDKISEFPRTATPRVGIYHSQVSSAMARYGRKIKAPMQCAYAAVLHAMYPVTFVFDNELAEGRLPDGIEAIVVPAADFERTNVREALERFAAHGGTVIADRKAFSFDERGRKASGSPAGAILYDAGPTNSEPVLAALKAAGIKKNAELIPHDGLGDIPGADVQVIDRGNFKLVLIVNLIAGSTERKARLALPIVEEGRWIVSDAVTDAPFNAPNGDETWTSEAIRNGIELALPYQERVLIAIQMKTSEIKPCPAK